MCIQCDKDQNLKLLCGSLHLWDEASTKTKGCLHRIIKQPLDMNYELMKKIWKRSSTKGPDFSQRMFKTKVTLAPIFKLEHALSNLDWIS